MAVVVAKQEKVVFLEDEALSQQETTSVDFGFAQTMGRRSGMEDALLVHGNLVDGDDMFGVFDGFGGSEVSQWLVKRAPEILRAELALAKAAREKIGERSVSPACDGMFDMQFEEEAGAFEMEMDFGHGNGPSVELPPTPKFNNNGDALPVVTTTTTSAESTLDDFLADYYRAEDEESTVSPRGAAAANWCAAKTELADTIGIAMLRCIRQLSGELREQAPGKVRLMDFAALRKRGVARSMQCGACLLPLFPTGWLWFHCADRVLYRQSTLHWQLG